MPKRRFGYFWTVGGIVTKHNQPQRTPTTPNQGSKPEPSPQKDPRFLFFFFFHMRDSAFLVTSRDVFSIMLFDPDAKVKVSPKT